MSSYLWSQKRGKSMKHYIFQEQQTQSEKLVSTVSSTHPFEKDGLVKQADLPSGSQQGQLRN
jgi:hypothetical protein